MKRTASADYDIRSRKFPALSLKKDDSLLTVLPVSDSDLLLITRTGMSIRFPVSAVPVQGRTASGVKGMSVDSEDEVCWAGQIADKDEIVLFSERGWAKRMTPFDFEPQNRGGKGVHCFSFNKNGTNGRELASVLLIADGTPQTFLVRQSRSPASRLKSDEILLQNRSGRGMPYLMAILDDVVTEGDE